LVDIPEQREGKKEKEGTEGDEHEKTEF